MKNYLVLSFLALTISVQASAADLDSPSKSGYTKQVIIYQGKEVFLYETDYKTDSIKIYESAKKESREKLKKEREEERKKDPEYQEVIKSTKKKIDFKRESENLGLWGITNLSIGQPKTLPPIKAETLEKTLKEDETPTDFFDEAFMQDYIDDENPTKDLYEEKSEESEEDEEPATKRRRTGSLTKQFKSESDSDDEQGSCSKDATPPFHRTVTSFIVNVL